jgi:hypothetical protein
MTEFVILGRTLRAAALSPGREAWLRSAWHFAEHEAAPVSFSISLEPASPPDVRFTGAPVRMPGIELPCLAVGENAWLIGSARGGVRLELLDGESRIGMWGSEEVLHPALFVALYESVRASGLVPLHASVIARDGAATALMARSGTGKSSTLVQAMRDGWLPIAEDFAWLEPDTLRLHGWDRGVHLWPDARERFAPDLRGWTMGSDGKLFHPWSTSGARAARLETIALLVRDPASPSRWDDLTPREAVRALWEAIGVPLSPRSRDEVSRLIPALLARVRTRRLVLGNTALPL